jgi:hypothetical protein
LAGGLRAGWALRADRFLSAPPYFTRRRIELVEPDGEHEHDADDDVLEGGAGRLSSAMPEMSDCISKRTEHGAVDGADAARQRRAADDAAAMT